MNFKKLFSVAVFSLMIGNVYGMQCGKLVDDGKAYPVDQEAKDLLAALKPSTNCDSKMFLDGVKIMGKKISYVTLTKAQETQIRKEIADRKETRVKKRLVKAGLVK
jgi:hypothetical protein